MLEYINFMLILFFIIPFVYTCIKVKKILLFIKMEIDELIATQTIDQVDTPKEGVVQYDRRGELKKIIEQGDAHLLNGNSRKKWTIERIDKATDKQIDNIWSKYKQEENEQKADKTGKAVGTHIVNLYSNGISKLISINDVNKLKKDIENDPIIKDSMADIGALLVGTFEKLLSPMLVVAHTVNNSEKFTKNITYKKKDNGTRDRDNNNDNSTKGDNERS